VCANLVISQFVFISSFEAHNERNGKRQFVHALWHGFVDCMGIKYSRPIALNSKSSNQKRDKFNIFFKRITTTSEQSSTTMQAFDNKVEENRSFKLDGQGIICIFLFIQKL
jgi:hypothetical protein